MSLKARRGAIVGLWVVAIGGWFLYQRSTGLGTTDTLQKFVDTARDAWWAPVVYLLLYAARPLVLFPAILLTIAAGILFGSVWGLVLAVIGANVSAMVAYAVGRGLAREDDEGAIDPEAFPADPEGTTAVKRLMAKWSERLRERSFTTVMVMRLLYVPYDLVNYASGILRIAPLPFLAATAIGSLPGTVSFVLAGSSIDRVDEGLRGFDLRVFGASVVLFGVSWAGARLLRQREENAPTDQPLDETKAARR